MESLGSITTMSVTTGNRNSNGMFRDCAQLEFVRIPSTITFIGLSSFYRCSSLQEVICEAVTPPTLLDTQVFSYTPISSGAGFIFVPAASIPDYAAASNWSTYASRLAPLEDYEDGGYVPFADSAVLAICVANWDTNGSGYMSKNECAAVTDVGYKFQGKTEITSFDEMNYFTKVTKLANNQFNGCSSLVSIGLDNITSITRTSGSATFGGCVSLLKVSLPSIVTLDGWAFQDCSSLRLADIGPNCTSIGWRIFQNCPMETLVCRAVIPPSMGDNTLKSTCNIYVPDESVDAYKAASGWSGRASYIKPLSEYTE